MDINVISPLELTFFMLLYDKMIYSIIKAVSSCKQMGCNVTSTQYLD